jgi:hypothetical protein
MRIRRAVPRNLAALAALMAAAACADTPTGDSPAQPPRPVANELAAPDTIIYEGEQVYEDVAREVPGYAGHWYDEEGNVVIALVDPAQAAAARRVIDAQAQPAPAQGERRTGLTRIIPATHSFATLRDWRNASTFGLLGVSGVVAVDLDEQRNAVTVWLTTANARPAAEAELRRVGVPLTGTLIEVIGTPVSYQTLQNMFRPLQAGYQIQRSGGSTCTLGVPTTAGATGYITNSHCTPTYWANSGTAFYQHTVGAPWLVGSESADPAGWPCAPNVCRWSDAARVTLAAGVPWANQIARSTAFGMNWTPGSITTGGVAAFNVSSTVQWWPLLGQLVDKVGRTTGWTRGTVTHSCVNFIAPPPAPAGRAVLCQYLMTNMAGPGDSGSPVFRQMAGNQAQVTGLLWGGVSTSSGMRSIFSARGAVFNDLGA